jgi:glutamine---fructose-6-phosphate transaminase (isomerizing)
MCGIIGVIGTGDAVPKVVSALKRLEYRGYDSAGVAVAEGNAIQRRRAVGNVAELVKVLKKRPLHGPTALGHIRWATHGKVTEANAHPHVSGAVAIVHNGIIENFRTLRQRLTKRGVRFATETDTEVVAALVAQGLRKGLSPRKAVRAAIGELEGAFALGILVAGEPGTLYAARRGSPLVVGFGKGGAVLGSDTLAIGEVADKVCYLEEGDFAVVTKDRAEVLDEKGKAVKRTLVPLPRKPEALSKGNYRFFMQKEILEQPTAIAETMGSFLDAFKGEVRLPKLPFDFKKISKINLVACGTSNYAARIAKRWFETLARLPAEADMASEFRYRELPVAKDHLNLFISQSGETLDTLSALRHCKKKGLKTAAIVNVPDSTMVREAGAVFLTHAGVEIAVASTKAFTCQLALLALIAIAAGRRRGALSARQETALVGALSEAPARIAEVLHHDQQIEALAQAAAKAKNVLYLARGALYPVALEGALKFKEITYIHAEGYPAGEMKHGPIALIEPGVLVVGLAPSQGLHAKTFSNLEEAAARGAKVILVSDAKGVREHGPRAFGTIEMPDVPEMALPLVYAVPAQLLAYHTAVARGNNVDQPRNLAKAVTVE